jgi:hypothetical protein
MVRSGATGERLKISDCQKYDAATATDLKKLAYALRKWSARQVAVDADFAHLPRRTGIPPHGRCAED